MFEACTSYKCPHLGFISCSDKSGAIRASLWTLAVLDWILTLKVALLLALASLKCVGDLEALSVSEPCMEFAPGLVKVFLWPRPGYVTKVLSTSFRSQVAPLRRRQRHQPMNWCDSVRVQTISTCLHVAALFWLIWQYHTVLMNLFFIGIKRMVMNHRNHQH